MFDFLPLLLECLHHGLLLVHKPAGFRQGQMFCVGRMFHNILQPGRQFRGCQQLDLHAFQFFLLPVAQPFASLGLGLRRFWRPPGVRTVSSGRNGLGIDTVLITILIQ